MDDDVVFLTQEEKKEIGKKIRKYRLEKHYSLEALATLVNMPVQSLDRMEKGDFEMYDDLSPQFYSQQSHRNRTHLKQ